MAVVRHRGAPWCDFGAHGSGSRQFVEMRTPFSRCWLLLAGLTIAWARQGAAQPADRITVERVVLRELFLLRERASRIVLYEGPLESAPALGAAGLPDGMTLSRLPAAQVDGESISAGALVTLFRRNPDGWRAWFQRFPGSSGLVERTAPLVRGDSAVMVVARTCGEHCQQGWIVNAARTGRTEWKVTAVEPFPLPRP